ncbi:unnamed protein product [Calicophoron daubneyi]|uniref:Amidase domain-containing protein n=1 Tax=Calicophoron daubneyi TaxID=300641 RepID=A0AAV2TQD6_CALDB
MGEVLRLKRESLKTSLSVIEKRIEQQPRPIAELRTLTDFELNDLRKKLGANEITAPDLLYAFQARAIELYRNGNSGIGEFIKDAEIQFRDVARSWDPEVVKAPLFGIPVSVQECCSSKGYDSTYGLVKLCDKPAVDDCILVKVLKAEGAIPFLLTATPQPATSFKGDNSIFGSMHNPYSDRHQPGGGATGEAVLLVQRGSPIGFGTDLSGGIRIPSVFCGLASLKPTTSRISAKGLFEIGGNLSENLKPSVGPIGRKVDHLAQAMLTILRPIMFHLDPNVPPLPFNSEIYKGVSKPKLKIGYYTTFSDSRLIKPVPAVQNAVSRAITVLRSKGHELVEFEPPTPYCALEIFIQSMFADGGRAYVNATDGEPIDEQCATIRSLLRTPDIFRGLADAITKRRIGETAAVARVFTRSKSAESTFKLVEQANNYRDAFSCAWVKAGDLDALICPTWACPAIPNQIPYWYVYAPLLYVALYNLLDYPAGTVPMDFVSEEDVTATLKEAEHFREIGDTYHQKFFELQEGTQHLPIGVQVVSRPFQEETVLRVMRELEERAK